MRARAALASSGLSLPPKRVVVNLAPADLPKEGSHYDLPIALALMAEFTGLAQHFLENEERLRLRRWAYAMRPSPTAIAGGIGSPRQRLAAMLVVVEA